MRKQLDRSGQEDSRRNVNDTAALLCAGSDRVLNGARLNLLAPRNSTIFKYRYHFATIIPRSANLRKGVFSRTRGFIFVRGSLCRYSSLWGPEHMKVNVAATTVRGLSGCHTSLAAVRAHPQEAMRWPVASAWIWAVANAVEPYRTSGATGMRHDIPTPRPRAHGLHGRMQRGR